MKFTVKSWLFLFFCVFFVTFQVEAQVDSLVGQITSSNSNSFARDISGDGRFVVIESNGDFATERTATRNNADGNTEIFLFDYAQRRIFQITNTTRVLNNTNNPATQENICIDINSTRPILSNDGRWIAFVSNATTSTQMMPNNTNPGNFNGNSFSATPNNCLTNPLRFDANSEIWLYQIPAVPTVNLSSGIEPLFVDLSAGSFIQVTNSDARSVPIGGTTSVPAFISDDNRDVSINDDGTALAFISNRNYAPDNANPVGDDNAEVFVYLRNAAAGQQIRQITVTPRATANAPIISAIPTISGNGQRVAFYSNATAPRGDTGNNSDNNAEVFLANLTANGTPTATNPFIQVTNTTNTNPSDVTVLQNPGRRLSRDGRFVLFETLSNQPAGGGTNQAGYGLYLYDVDNPATVPVDPSYRQIGPRGDADAGVPLGDVRRFPSFSDYSGTTPTSIIFTSRLNFRPDGTVPTTASEGLNPDAARPIQIFAVPITTATPTFTRISRFPTAALFEAQAFPSNTRNRIVFNLPIELGGGNSDNTLESFYLLTPNVVRQGVAERVQFTTGASNLPVGAEPSPTPTPTPSPSPSPSPTPQTPIPVRGLSPDMVASINLLSGVVSPVEPRTATGVSTNRRFVAPIELSGVTVSINNVAAPLLSVSARQIDFITPAGLAPGTYAVVVNLNGVVVRSTLEIVAARPDIFRLDNVTAGGGRAAVFNATNRVLQSEPFAIRSPRIRGGGLVPTRLRVFLSGVRGVPASALTIRVGSLTIPAANILTGAVPTERPGVYSIDFLLPPEARGLGDVPIVISVNAGSVVFRSRLDDTAARITIL